MGLNSPQSNREEGSAPSPFSFPGVSPALQCKPPRPALSPQAWLSPPFSGLSWRVEGGFPSVCRGGVRGQRSGDRPSAAWGGPEGDDGFGCHSGLVRKLSESGLWFQGRHLAPWSASRR